MHVWNWKILRGHQLQVSRFLGSLHFMSECFVIFNHFQSLLTKWVFVFFDHCLCRIHPLTYRFTTPLPSGLGMSFCLTTSLDNFDVAMVQSPAPVGTPAHLPPGSWRLHASRTASLWKQHQWVQNDDFKLWGGASTSHFTKSLHRTICANTKGMGKNQGDCTWWLGSQKDLENHHEKKHIYRTETTDLWLCTIMKSESQHLVSLSQISSWPVLTYYILHQFEIGNTWKSF